MLKSNLKARAIKTIIFVSFFIPFLNISKLYASADSIPFHLGLYISQFLNPQETAKDLSQVNKFFLEVSRSTVLRRVSPFGVMLKDSKRYFWQESVHKKVSESIVSFVNLPYLMAHIPISEYKYLLAHLYDNHSKTFKNPENLNNLEEVFFRNHPLTDNRLIQAYDESRKILHLHSLLFIMSSLRCNAWNLARNIAIQVSEDDGLSASWASTSSVICDCIWDLSRDAAMKSGLEGLRQQIDNFIKRSLWEQYYDLIKQAVLEELMNHSESGSTQKGKLSFFIADKISRLVLINHLNPMNPDRLTDAAYKLATSHSKKIKHPGVFDSEETWKEFHFEYLQNLDEKQRVSVDFWIKFLDEEKTLNSIGWKIKRPNSF